MALMAGSGRYIPTMSKSLSRKETSVVLTVCKALGTKEVFETGILRASSIPIMMDKIHRESERYGFRKRYEEIASRLSAKMRKKIKKTSRR
jgi:cobalamin biosynthesis protein CbiD